MSHNWSRRDRPEQLERRCEFSDYAHTRRFLQQLEVLCEEYHRYPDISFGRTYVNLTVRPEADGEAVGASDDAFAEAIDRLMA